MNRLLSLTKYLPTLSRKTLKSCSFGSFSQYVSTALGYWCISIPVDSSDWPNAKCTCPAYLKNYVCKHNTGVSVLKKYASKAIPFAAKTLPLGQKRGRGRPSLALSCLMRQPNIYASILDEDAPEDNDDVDMTLLPFQLRCLKYRKTTSYMTYLILNAC